MKSDWLAGERFLGGDKVRVGAPTSKIVATLNAANLFSSLYVEHGDATVQRCHRNLLAVWPVRDAQRCNRTIDNATLLIAAMLCWVVNLFNNKALFTTKARLFL